MIDETHLIFLHGQESNSQGSKARFLRRLFPEMLIPDFTGTLEERMAALYPILGQDAGWRIIG
jgi:hypothetical protein